MQAENVRKSLVFNGWKHFHVIIQPGMQVTNDSFGCTLLYREKCLIWMHGPKKTIALRRVSKSSILIGIPWLFAL